MAKDFVRNEETAYITNIGSYKFKKFLKNFLVYFLLILQGLITLLPFYIMILTSIKDPKIFLNQNQVSNFQWWVPLEEAIKNGTSNYVNAYNKIMFGKVMVNTFIVAIIGTIGTVITTVLAAYAFGRLNFKGKNLLFTILMTTMMLPGEIFIITNYSTVASLGWIVSSASESYKYLRTILVETVPFMTSVYYVYYLKQTFMSVPNELYYAAKVDGTSDLKYLFKVMIPVASGTIISITILNAMGSWNAYIWPTLVSSIPEYYLVTQALRNTQFFVPGQSVAIDYAGQMAAAFMVTVPLLIIFFTLKKYIMRGVSRSGIKG